MIQLWFKIFFPRRVQVTEDAAQLLQRQFRGHLGRVAYREKKRLQERARGLLFRILNRTLAMCFETWRATARQIRGCRQIIKRAVFGTLIDRFDKWRDITKESQEWRKHKLRCELITRVSFDWERGGSIAAKCGVGNLPPPRPVRDCFHRHCGRATHLPQSSSCIVLLHYCA